ncbi:hypothetical protein BDL97_17G012000 [Sphagnum fallax]|nr:hypothetical protein BDL97_17G012000 [Sphagnum fallax]
MVGTVLQELAHGVCHHPSQYNDWPSPSLHSLNELWTRRVPDTQSAEGGQSMISAQVSAPIFQIHYFSDLNYQT